MSPFTNRASGTSSKRSLRRLMRVPRWLVLLVIACLLMLWLVFSHSAGIPKPPVHVVAPRGAFASIGVLNSVDAKQQRGVTAFFSSNGIPCCIEGTMMFDVLVHTQDEARAKALLDAKGNPDDAFRSKWEREYDWSAIRRHLHKLLRTR